jgi:hypothetical protein
VTLGDFGYPVFLHPKTFNYLTHLRTPNYVSSSDTYAILKIDDCIDKIKHATFVSKFDLLTGCW